MASPIHNFSQSNHSPVARIKCWQSTFLQTTNTFTFVRVIGFTSIQNMLHHVLDLTFTSEGWPRRWCNHRRLVCWADRCNSRRSRVSTLVSGTSGWFKGTSGQFPAVERPLVEAKTRSFPNPDQMFLCLNQTKPWAQLPDKVNKMP